MTKNRRIFGGICTLFGSSLCFIIAYLFPYMIVSDIWKLVVTFFVPAGICGVIGGILLLVDKNAGGIMAIIAGALSIVAYLFAFPELMALAVRYLFTYLMPAGCQLVGGIVGLTVGKEF
jgi:predicted phage tail protein